jgi:integrase
MPALITVAYHTGLRVGSILTVRGKDIDLDAGTLVVNRTLGPSVPRRSPAVANTSPAGSSSCAFH